MVHPFGGTERVIGTNPLVIAVPSDSGPPLVHDFATSAIANGKVKQAQMRGENLPEGVALGPDGLPTRDPAAAQKGSLAPMGGEIGGGHKGFGLGLCIGLLAGPLVGAMTGKAAIGGYEPGKRSNKGEIIIAMDPAAFGDPAVFSRAVGAHLAEVRNSRKAHGSEGIRIPGERGFVERERRLKEGVPVDPSVWRDLARLAEGLGVPLPACSCDPRPIFDERRELERSACHFAQREEEP
jgi:L-2-hydroxycarboxylate dehydrogenase (NAD+)